MTGRQIITDTQNTWCPGCGNFSIQHTLKNVLNEMEQDGKSLDDVVLVSGIGAMQKSLIIFISTVFTLFSGERSRSRPASNLATPG